jgi:hypothetical protein
MVLGLPPPCIISWPSIAAMIISAKWLWADRPRRAFLLACINILPAASWLAAEEQGRMKLRVGYYVWLAGLVVWALGVGCFVAVDRGKPAVSAKAKSLMDDL